MMELPFQIRDLDVDGGIDGSIRQSIELNWFRFRESPTNTSFFPLNFSNNAVAFNLDITEKPSTANCKLLVRLILNTVCVCV